MNFQSGGSATRFESEVGRAVVRTGLIPVIAMDVRGHVVHWTAAAEQMFGYSEAEAVGRELAELIVPARLRELHRAGLHRYLDQASPAVLRTRIETQGLRADGTEFPADVAIIRDDSGEEPLIIGMVRDVTKRREAEERLERTVSLLAEAEELAGVGSFDRNLRTGEATWSEGMYRMFEHPPSLPPLAQAEILDRFHPDDQPSARAQLEAMHSHVPYEFRQRLRLPSRANPRRVIEMSGRVNLDGGGDPRLVGTIRDVTAELEARRLRELHGYVVESSDDAILTKDSAGIVTSWNRGAERLYGFSAEEIVGQPIARIVPPELLDEQRELTTRAFNGESIHRHETERICRDGRRVIVSLTVSPVRDGTGAIVSAAVMGRDVTERRRYEERLRHLADHDPLTGLLNRRRFEHELRRELSRAARERSGGAMLSLDLDTFKAVNDSAGHAAGDTVLVEVARTLEDTLRESDVIARLGGDEFAVLLPGADVDAAGVAAEHLLEALRRCRVEIDGVTFKVGASIGGVTFPDDATEAGELLTGADLAMYLAKQQGRDRVVVFTPEEADAARTDASVNWSERIRRALSDDDLELYWQPIVRLADNEVSHGELLLRMRRGGDLISPTSFLETAERFGLIHGLDRWVVCRAVAMLARADGVASRPLSINLSAEAVGGDSGLLGLIEDELSRAGVDPRMLIFEIPETAAIADVTEAKRFVAGLHRLGCRIALDDFGTGFGSFYHLKHLPVDFLKIDREFIEDLTHSDIDQRLVRSIADVAGGLGISTVAEAVGDERTIELLAEFGVDYVQGLYVGTPVPVELKD